MRIGEFAELTGASQRSLRYYEEQGLVHPRRTAAGQRVFEAEDIDKVVQIQELFAAGFCSKVIRQLLSEITEPVAGNKVGLSKKFDAAQSRLESEKREIERELAELRQLRDRLDLAPDTPVKGDADSHERIPTSPPTSIDHRDRRLR